MAFYHYPDFPEYFSLDGPDCAKHRRFALDIGKRLVDGNYTVEYAANPTSAPFVDISYDHAYVRLHIRPDVGQSDPRLREWLRYPAEGKYRATVAFNVDDAVYVVPDALVALLRDMTENGENARGGERLRRYWEAYAEAERELERDPEGAFGGRGNNAPNPARV